MAGLSKLAVLDAWPWGGAPPPPAPSAPLSSAASHPIPTRPLPEPMPSGAHGVVPDARHAKHGDPEVLPRGPRHGLCGADSPGGTWKGVESDQGGPSAR